MKKNEENKKSNFNVIQKIFIAISVLVTLVLIGVIIYVKVDESMTTIYCEEIGERIEFSCNSWINGMPSESESSNSKELNFYVSNIDDEDFENNYEIQEISINDDIYEQEDIKISGASFSINIKNIDLENKSNIKIKVKNVNTDKTYTIRLKVQLSLAV